MENEDLVQLKKFLKEFDALDLDVEQLDGVTINTESTRDIKVDSVVAKKGFFLRQQTKWHLGNIEKQLKKAKKVVANWTFENKTITDLNRSTIQSAKEKIEKTCENMKDVEARDKAICIAEPLLLSLESISKLSLFISKDKEIKSDCCTQEELKEAFVLLENISDDFGTIRGRYEEELRKIASELHYDMNDLIDTSIVGLETNSTDVPEDEMEEQVNDLFGEIGQLNRESELYVAEMEQYDTERTRLEELMRENEKRQASLAQREQEIVMILNSLGYTIKANLDVVTPLPTTSVEQEIVEIKPASIAAVDQSRAVHTLYENVEQEIAKRKEDECRKQYDQFKNTALACFKTPDGEDKKNLCVKALDHFDTFEKDYSDTEYFETMQTLNAIFIKRAFADLNEIEKFYKEQALRKPVIPETNDLDGKVEQEIAKRKEDECRKQYDQFKNTALACFKTPEGEDKKKLCMEALDHFDTFEKEYSDTEYFEEIQNIQAIFIKKAFADLNEIEKFYKDQALGKPVISETNEFDGKEDDEIQGDSDVLAEDSKVEKVIKNVLTERIEYAINIEELYEIKKLVERNKSKLKAEHYENLNKILESKIIDLDKSSTYEPVATLQPQQDPVIDNMREHYQISIANAQTLEQLQEVEDLIYNNQKLLTLSEQHYLQILLENKRQSVNENPKKR